VIRFARFENPLMFSTGGLHPLDMSDSHLVRAVQSSDPTCTRVWLQMADVAGVGKTRVERVVIERFGGDPSLNLKSCPAVLLAADPNFTPFGSVFAFSARVIDSAADGIQIDPGRAIALSNCEVSGSAVDGIVMRMRSGGQPASITGCNLQNNLGVGIRNEMAFGQVAATDNWWADATGPNGPTGDGVAGDVDASSPRAAPVVLGY